MFADAAPSGNSYLPTLILTLAIVVAAGVLVWKVGNSDKVRWWEALKPHAPKRPDAPGVQAISRGATPAPVTRMDATPPFVAAVSSARPTVLDGTGTTRLSLREIARDHGAASLDDPKLLATLLPDLLPHSPREARLIRAAAELGVGRLLSNRIARGLSPSMAIRDVSAVLATDALLESASSEWIVTEYAIALGHANSG